MEHEATYTTVSVWDEISGTWNELGEWTNEAAADKWIFDRQLHNALADTSERFQVKTVHEYEVH
jgi:hypothetical protein